MRGTNNSTGRRSDPPKTGSMRKGALLGATLLAIAVVIAFFVFRPPPNSNNREEPAVISAPQPKANPIVAQVVAAPPTHTPVASEWPPAIAPVMTEPGPRTASQLMAELTELSTHGPITAEQAERFKADLAELVRQGAASVPAILEFLNKNSDAFYANVEGGEQLGYPSLRAGLFDTLRQIGGQEAQAAMLQVLQTAAIPSEVLELAKDLEQGAPGQYRDQILSAAHEALNMAYANQLGSNVEIGPIFRLLQAYDDTGAGADATRNNPEAFNQAVAMANLPEGQGLPSLVQMAENPNSSSRTLATEMIAQLAGQNAQAVDTLMQMAEKGEISNRVWTRLAPILGGDQYQISPAGGDAQRAGNQNVAVVNVVTTPDQINQRIGLIDQFLGVVPGDSAAANALQQQRGILLSKLGK